LLDGIEVGGVAGVFEVQDATVGDGVAETLKGVVSAFLRGDDCVVDVLRSEWAIRNRTCRRLGRRRRRGLLGIPVRCQEWLSSKAGEPTMPITYLGFFSGKRPVHVSTLLGISGYLQ